MDLRTKNRGNGSGRAAEGRERERERRSMPSEKWSQSSAVIYVQTQQTVKHIKHWEHN